MNSSKLAAAWLGSFVFGGCDSAVRAAGLPEVGIGPSGVSLAFGLTVLTMPSAVGHFSGGHFNPAVSLGLTLFHPISIPVSNTSVNPAGSTAVVLFAETGALSQLWLFWVAPLAGVALGAFLHRTLLASDD